MSKNNKIIKYHRGFNFDIGFFIFIIIIIYVLYHLFSYIISSPIAEYEVHQGTITANNTYHGLILRDETIECAEQSGSVNYYIANNSKVSVNDIIYSIDTNDNISKKIDSAVNEGSFIDNGSLSQLVNDIDSFVNLYQSVDFSSVYSFKQKLASELSRSISTQALTSFSEDIEQAANSTFFTAKSSKPGIVTYCVDGYENISVDNFTTDNLNGIGYQKTNLYDNKKVNANSPVYKRINSERWNIIISVPESTAKRLEEGSYVKIRFPKDDYVQNVAYTIIKKEDRFFVNLNLNKAMIRYLDERFIDVELVLNNESGLKIPISSITSKDFYKIPKEYFSEGGDSNMPGVMVQSPKDSNSISFVAPTIYYEDEEFYYVDGESVKSGDIIVKPDSMSKYTIGSDIGSLKGVYNINKGYAVFKQINILSENDEYAIVETKTRYGLSLYDHIALDGSKIKEDQAVIR